MKQEIEKELEKLKDAPTYIDLFCNVMRQKLGDNREAFNEAIAEAIAYNRNQEKYDVYTKLVALQLEYDLIYGELNHATKVGEEALDFFENKEYIEGIIIVSEKLMIAYMHKGLFKKAEYHRRKATLALQELGEKVKPEDTQGQKLHIRLTLTTIRFYMMIKEYKKVKELLLHIDEMHEWLTPEEIQEKLKLYLELELVKGQLERAIELAQEVYNLSDQDEMANQKYALAEVLRLRGILNSKRNLYIQAERDFNLAYDLCKDFKEAQIKNLISWAEYLMEQERNDEAYEKITKSIKLAGKIDSPYFFVEAYEHLGRVYENKKQWELAYKALRQLNIYKVQMESIQIEEPQEQEVLIEPTKQYKQNYAHVEQIARLGKALTNRVTMETLPEVIHKEIAPLMDIDVIGIAALNQGKLDYNVYELSGKWLPSDNDLVKYTLRLADYCTQFQADMVVNDGNFEEYTIKNIRNSETNMKLKSMIVCVLKVENQVLGAMALGSYKEKAYSSKDIVVAKVLGSYIALILNNMKLSQKIHYLSNHDALTGLLSRHIVLRKGEKLFKENHKKHKNTAIMMLHIDLLKPINTKYGNELGDEVLSKIGMIIKENIPENDYAGRYDGEEFIVILNNLSYKEVTKVAERIKECIECLTFETKRESQIKVTLSGGIYICNEYTLNFDDAIRFADHALYRAKLLGRNRIMSYSLSDIK